MSPYTEPSADCDDVQSKAGIIEATTLSAEDCVRQRGLNSSYVAQANDAPAIRNKPTIIYFVVVHEARAHSQVVLRILFFL